LLLRRAAARAPGLLVTAGLTGALAVVAGLLLPGATARAVDAALAGDPAAAGVPLLLGVVAVIAGADAVNEIATNRLVATSTAGLRRITGARLVGCGDERASGEPGDVVSRLTGDAAQAGAVASTAIQIVLGTVTSVGAVVALALLDPWLAVVFAASLPLALW